MKYLIASDIHGSHYYAKKLIDAFESEKANKLILLGDLLYHGPRNPLPKEYNPLNVAELLNKHKSNIIAVRGNCDSEVDQMVLNFPIMADYTIVNVGNRTLFATHGHIFNRENLPLLNKGDVFMHGHTHVCEIANCSEYIFLNPGSISMPKENTQNSYAVFENDKISIKNLNGEEIHSLNL